VILNFLNKVLIILITLCCFNQMLGVEDLRIKYPDGLLTLDYGILSENDLKYDIKRGNPRPYLIKEFQPGYYRWQCFKTESVKYKYDVWKDNDPMGPSDTIVPLCFFGVHVKSEKIQHLYIDRRARRLEFCQEIENEWKELTRDETYLCLNGEPHGLKHTTVSWTWNKMKTKKGCISLFSGDCNIKM
jgi:hypothetical protein